jgi:PBSX family phage terminase large subunit
MNVLKEYEPLYKEPFYVADLNGGRAGARSYHASQYALYQLLYSNYFRGFFLRDIHSTIYTSIWKDFKDRIAEFEDMHHSLDGIIKYTDNKNGENSAINLHNGNEITTKGFKVSSGSQTANLKSLAGGSCILIEEFQEVDKDDYLKLKLSLRKKDVNIQIIRSFNPVPKDHYVWQDYELIELELNELVRLVQQVGAVSNEVATAIVMRNQNRKYYTAKPKDSNHISIHCNYLNNYKNLNEIVIEEYKKILIFDYHYFMVEIVGLIPDKQGHVVYSDYDRERCHTDRVVKDGDILHIGMDFNITNMSAIVHVVDGEEPKAVAELTKIFDTEQMIRKIHQLYPNHKILIYPDASGDSRKTSSGSETDHLMLRKAGFSVLSGKTNPAVKDRVNTMNLMFRKGYKVNKFTCPDYVEALSKLLYKNGEPDKSSGFDHATEAGGYFIHYNYRAPKTRLLI